MRRHLPALLIVAALLAGCGGENALESQSQSQTSPRPDAPSMSIGDPVQEPTVVAVVTGTAAGGRVSDAPVPVGDPAALREFVDQFEGDLARKVSRAAATASVPDGQTLLAAVVDIGCNPPTGVQVEVGDGGVRVVPTRDGKSKEVICYAEITTVAIVTAVV